MSNSDNPLLDRAATVPAFDLIRPEHFVPAYEIALAESRAAFERIKADSAAPTFENTVLPLNALFEDATRIAGIMDMLDLAVGGDAYKEAREQIFLLHVKAATGLYQDHDLAARFKAVYDVRNALPLDAQDLVVLEKLHLAFESSGAFLDEAGQKRLQALGEELIALCTSFNKNLEKGARYNAVFISDPSQLAGVPSSYTANMKESAEKAVRGEIADLPPDLVATLKGRQETGLSSWLLIPERMQVSSLLDVAASRPFREKIFKALNNIGVGAPFDNRQIVMDIGRKRAEYAQLLGYESYADFALKKTMIGNREKCETFLKDVAAQALPRFEEELSLLQDYARKTCGLSMLEPWDFQYWATRYKEETFGHDAEAFSSYFALDDVMDGLFAHAEKLFGLEFVLNNLRPSYHQDVKVFDVRHRGSDEVMGVLYADFYARGDEGKSGGAWMTPTQSASSGKPALVSFNLNLMKGSRDKPTLLAEDDVITAFHEFGHGLHGLLGMKTKYESQRGIASTSDVFEFYSMVQENWAFHPQCLDSYAFHHATRQPLPAGMRLKAEACNSFLKSWTFMLLVQNSLTDLTLHKMNPDEVLSVEDIRKRATIISPFAEHVRAAPLTRFSHLFGEAFDDYASGYCGYLWAEMHARDAFVPFQERGAYDPHTASLLKIAYEQGSSLEPNHVYETYRGRPATTEALLKTAGITMPTGNTKTVEKQRPPAPLI